MRYWHWCALVLLLCAGVARAEDAGEVTSGGSAKIDEIVAQYMKDDAPGGVVVVVRNGKAIHLKGYGRARMEPPEPWTSRTRQDLASCSKAFTAFAALILIERGKLALADDIRKYLPEWPEKNPKRPIHVSDVMHMIAGLPPYEDKTDDVAAIADNVAAIKSIAGDELAYPTGTKHEYSNSAYCMLAVIVSRAAGQPFPAFLKKEIFDPLGMSDTYVMEAPGPLADRRCVPYAKKKKKWKDVRNDTHVFGDGQVVTCGVDLVKWAVELDRPTRCKRETLELAFTPGKLDSGEDCEYGMGWFPDPKDGHRRMWHTGGWDGVASYVTHLPDDHFTILIVSNDEDMSCGDLGEAIEDLMLSRAKKAAKRAAKKLARRKKNDPEE